MDLLVPEFLQYLGAGVANRIGHCDQSRKLTVHGSEQNCFGLFSELLCSGLGYRYVDACSLHLLNVSHKRSYVTVLSLQHGADASAGTRFEIRDRQQVQATQLRCAQDCASDRMLTMRFHARN